MTSLKINDSQNPQQWATSHKWLLTIFISLYALMGPYSAAMVVPALPEMSRDLELSSETSTQLVVSIFVLGWSLGQVLMGPLSERYGRSKLLNMAYALLLLVNVLCAIEKNGTRFLVLRLLGGIAGSAPLAVSHTLGDYFNSYFTSIYETKSICYISKSS